MCECVRRPRLYRDRRWLAGYSEQAEAIRDPFGIGIAYPRLSRLAARFLVGVYLRRETALTAFECGQVDAILDAFGC